MMHKQQGIELHLGDCLELIKNIPDGSIDVILTDPPYLYLKNQKLEREFNEVDLFTEWKRVLKKGGFIVLFGRGTSFYRWNTRLDELGFEFKEEIVWNKSQGSSPLMSLTRVHETVSIHCLGKGSINKVKVPYLEMKGDDIPSIVQDIKRMRSILKNTKSLNAVIDFLENNKRDVSDSWKSNNLSISSQITKEDRSVSVARSIQEGLNEKTIIRTDMERPNNPRKGVTAEAYKPTGDRSVNVMQSVAFGFNEKSIIKQVRDHYTSIHPTQKPVRLLERLLALVSKEGDTVLDCFAGSASTAEACINTQRKFIGFEIDEEYYKLSVERLKAHEPQLTMF